MEDIRDAILANDTCGGVRHHRDSRQLPGDHDPQGRSRTCSPARTRATRTRGVDPPRRGAGARTRAGRGAGGGDGQRHQLQHGLVVDFEPVSTFGFLERYGRLNESTKRPTCPTTSSARTWPAWCCGPVPESARKPGDEVVAHCLSVEPRARNGHNDTMMDPEQRIWGFETNFGGLAELAIVKSNQLLPGSPSTSPGRNRRAPAWSTPPRTGSSSPATVPA